MSHQDPILKFPQSLFSLCPIACIHAATFVVSENGGQANTPVTNRATRLFLIQGGREDSMGGLWLSQLKSPDTVQQITSEQTPNTCQILQLKRPFPTPFPPPPTPQRKSTNGKKKKKYWNKIGYGSFIYKSFEHHPCMKRTFKYS